MWSELFADAIHEELDSAALRADVDVKVLAVGKQLAELSENAPTGSLMKSLRSDILQRLVAARASHWIHCSSA